MISIIFMFIFFQPSANKINPPTEVSRTELRSTYFNVTWYVEPNTNYKVVIQLSDTSAPAVPPPAPDVTSPYLVNITFSGMSLQPHTKYDSYVFAVNPMDVNDFAHASQTGITTAPPAPTNVTISNIGVTKFEIIWDQNMPTKTGDFHEINGYQVTYTTNGGTSQTKQGNGLQTYLTINGLTPNTGYTVSVRGTTTASGSDVFTDNSTSVHTFTIPGSPSLPFLSQPTGSLADPSTMIKVDWNKPDGGDAIDNYAVEWKLTTASSYISSATVTHVVGTTSFSYIINSLIPGGSYDVRVRARNLAGDGQPSMVSHLTTKPFSPQYRVTASTNQLGLTWNQPDGFFDGFVVELVDFPIVKLDNTATSHTFHGLNESTEYTITMYSWVDVGNGTIERSSFNSRSLKTLSVASTDVIVVGIVVPACIICLLIVALCFYRRREKNANKSDLLKSNEAETQTNKIIAQPEASNYLKIDKSTDRRVIAIPEFNTYMKTMTTEDDNKLFHDYEVLKSIGNDQMKDVAVLPVNLAKNRYKKSIFCYDATRVKLTLIEGVEGSCYINANYIKGYNGEQEFIATQGPLRTTKNDFWRMIWEQNSRTVVMLTQTFEEGRAKCDRYWPDDDKVVNVGDIILQRTTESVSQDWTLRQFQLTYKDEVRDITQFHYTAWPDHGVPDTAENLVKFIRYIRKTIVDDAETTGPITVHCSAGVGRSGTFIAIDHLLQRMREHSDVDIYGIVYGMRQRRGAMVQNYKQYVLLHKMVQDVINDAYENDEEENLYENTEVAEMVYENVAFSKK